MSSSAQTPTPEVTRLIKELNAPGWKLWVSPAKAAQKLAALGPEAGAAAPALVEKIRGLCPSQTDTKRLDAEVVQSAFADALVAIGEPALEHLPLHIDEAQESYRYAMVEIVARFGRVAVPRLISALRKGSKHEQSNAAWAVESMKETAYEALPAVHMALAKALAPDTIVTPLDKDGELRNVEIRDEYTEADIAFLERLRTGAAPKPFQLRDHWIILPCLAVLKKFGGRAAETIPTVEFAIAVARDASQFHQFIIDRDFTTVDSAIQVAHKGMLMAIQHIAEDTLKALRKN